MLQNLTFEIKDIASVPFYTEGPVIDISGNRFVTNLSGGNILKINHDNTITEWAVAICPNGQTIAPNGSHLICDTKSAAIKCYDEQGNFIKDEIQGFILGEEIYCPNDVITDLDGNIYFTDSVRHKGKVCFVGINGKHKIIADQLDYPNGLVLLEETNTLYIAESYTNRILAIQLDEPAQVKVFCELPNHLSGKKEDNLPDGLALDTEGNIWVAHYGMGAVQVVSPSGELLATVETQIPLTSNLAFTNQNTLLVTGGYGEPGPGAIKEIKFYETY